MSAYLLDTNTCVEYLRSRNAGVVQRIQSTLTSEMQLCSVVLGELYYGALHSVSPSANLALLRKFLAGFTSLPFDDAAAEQYGDIRAQLRQRGTPIGPHDIQIAAIALSRNLTVVTHNVAEFSRVPGLTVEDWQL